MTQKNNHFFKMSETDKQKMPHPDEIDPKNSFTKISTASSRSAKKFKLKGLRLDEKIKEHN